MAERFGGKYSPQNSRTEGAAGIAPVPGMPARSKAVGRSRALFLPPFLFAALAFKGEPRSLIMGLAACGILLLAAWLTQQGAVAQDAYDARKVARRPAIPRKAFGAVLMCVGLCVGALVAQPPLYAILLGLAGLILHVGAFGLDPMRDKGMEGVDSFQVERVARAVDEAEGLLASMKDAILRARDSGLEARVAKFSGVARGLFRSIESDPGDLTAARKYLSVYLMGARDATVKFADAYAQGRDPKIRADYETLLGELETTFAARTQSLLQGDHTDLDVEIQVLRDRLKLET
ncbi:5-bromo-4-chloroindolyl phosphate hydrolysis family protein [Cypionkella sinensis]|uniref:5-bromo-4-chloroindolyl phosphate hydrolysis family protein n=1 Tax=Cypionkella sinensis TaxID=1756043 RepID=A0ABV7J4P1_9RHOB